MFSIRGAGQLVTSHYWKYFLLNHESEPMDITHARVCKLCRIYAGEHNLSQSESESNDGVMTELSAYSLTDDERRIYFNIC